MRPSTHRPHFPHPNPLAGVPAPRTGSAAASPPWALSWENVGILPLGSGQGNPRCAGSGRGRTAALEQPGSSSEPSWGCRGKGNHGKRENHPPSQGAMPWMWESHPAPSPAHRDARAGLGMLQLLPPLPSKLQGCIPGSEGGQEVPGVLQARAQQGFVFIPDNRPGNWDLSGNPALGLSFDPSLTGERGTDSGKAQGSQIPWFRGKNTQKHSWPNHQPEDTWPRLS